MIKNQHYYKTLHGPKAYLVELNLWTRIPTSTTTRAMLDPEADEVDGQTDTDGLVRNRKDVFHKDVLPSKGCHGGGIGRNLCGEGIS